MSPTGSNPVANPRLQTRTAQHRLPVDRAAPDARCVGPHRATVVTENCGEVSVMPDVVHQVAVEVLQSFADA